MTAMYTRETGLASEVTSGLMDVSNQRLKRAVIRCGSMNKDNAHWT